MNRLWWGTLLLLLVGCKSTPDQYVYSSGALKQDNQVFLQDIEAQGFDKEELTEVAAQAFRNGRCDKALLLAEKFNLPVNYRTDYQTLFQCLMQKKHYDLAERALALGAEPAFVPSADPDQDNALVLAARYGQLSLVKALMKAGQTPGKAAFHAGVSGEYHRDPEMCLKMLDTFRPYVSRSILRYRSGDAPVLYQLLTNQFTETAVLPIVRELLQLGVLPDDGQQRNAVHPAGATFAFKDTPLLLVPEQSVLAAMLIKAGADPAARAKRQRAERLAAIRSGMTLKQGLVIDIRKTGVQVQDSAGSRWLNWSDISI